MKRSLCINMANAQPKPFDFTDLTNEQSNTVDPSKAKDETELPLIDASEMELAHAKGVDEGEQKALDSLAAAEAESLRSIASILAAKEFNFEEAIDREKISIRESAGAFLEQFCSGVMQEREIELAETLLCQLISASKDRSRATLFLNPDSVKKLEDRLKALLDNHGVGDFFSFEGDSELSPGDCRVEWRGGAIRRTKTEIQKAMVEIFGVEITQESVPAAKSIKQKALEPKS